MSTLTAPTTALDVRSRLVAAYARAFDRAIAAKLVCFHDRTEDTYAVPSTSQPGEYHTVRHLGGSDWANLSCTCKAASHPACLHRAVVAFARARHISASLPRCGACDDRFCNGGCPLTTPVVDTASTTEPCRHDWQGRDGGSEYVCAKCGAGWSYEDVYATDWDSISHAPYYADQIAETETDGEPCRHQWVGRGGGSEYVCRLCGARHNYQDVAASDWQSVSFEQRIAETETDEEPPLAVQEDAQLLAMERALHPVQRPAPLPAAWVPSAGVGFVRAVTLDGASPAYRASVEADAAAIVAAAVRDYGPDPLAALWS